MNTLIELADEYARNCFSDGVHDIDIEHPHTEKARAALVAGIEELQAEVERLKSERDRNLDSIRVNNEIINKKNAELDALKGAEPVAHEYELELPDGDKRTASVHWTDRNVKDSCVTHHLCISVSAAPQAPAPERNFCERCGKRLVEGHIHTCTPPTGEAQG